ncbi:MAG: triose-phosphate isomerase [Planctomyces sp.]|nr:triose-phosphate isomerase [Planctomyces sp.]MBA4120349.1 triose-phosphate isomerase [Isosphaera sp.]
MHPSRRPIIGGNWKMNTDRASGAALARQVAAGAAAMGQAAPDTVVFPPFVYLDSVAAALAGSPVQLGAQDVYQADHGAFTGEVSPPMLRDVGCRWVLVGHSERRHVLHEGDDLINAKLLAVLRAGLHAVLCVGEKLEQRLTGQTDTINERQARSALRHVEPQDLWRVVIAYEPVWAIGTGKTATPADAQAAHAHIRAVLADLYSPHAAAAARIQYGGSVTPANAHELLAQPDIDGALVGGASLKPADFLAILAAAGAGKA